jgi:uncharacterized protein YodC (DUF2158 family)
MIAKVTDIATRAVKFKRGDIVRLKSGGPVMTINDLHEDGDKVVSQWNPPAGHVTCLWFGPSYSSAFFHIDALERKRVTRRRRS